MAHATRAYVFLAITFASAGASAQAVFVGAPVVVSVESAADRVALSDVVHDANVAAPLAGAPTSVTVSLADGTDDRASRESRSRRLIIAGATTFAVAHATMLGIALASATPTALLAAIPLVGPVLGAIGAFGVGGFAGPCMVGVACGGTTSGLFALIGGAFLLDAVAQGVGLALVIAGAAARPRNTPGATVTVSPMAVHQGAALGFSVAHF